MLGISKVRRRLSADCAPGDSAALVTPAIAIDSSGTIYLVWDTSPRLPGTSGGCAGAETPAANSIMLTYSKDGGTTWAKPATVAHPGTTVLWPWITAGDAGKDATADRWHRLARYHEAARQTAEATAAVLKALEKDPKSIPVLASAARIHESGGNLLAAADIHRRLAAVDRRFRTEYLTNVAKLEARLGRREQALQAGRDLLAAAPGNPEHFKFYADLCFQLGESEDGLESLRKSVRVNPSDPQGLITLAQALAERFRTGEAIELLWRAFEKTNDLDGKAAVVARLTELYLQNNQFDKLTERLERERRMPDPPRCKRVRSQRPCPGRARPS